MSEFVHYGVKGMKWGVRKIPRDVRVSQMTSRTGKLVTSGGGYAENEEVDVDKVIDTFADIQKKTLKESAKMIKMGVTAATPVIKSLGSITSNIVKTAAIKGKEILNKLDSFFSKRSKEAELEYKQRTLTKEQKKAEMSAAWEKAKKKRIADSIRRDRYS